MFTWSLLSFLKIPISNSPLDKLQIFMSLGSITARLLLSFLWYRAYLFFMFLEVLSCYLCIWSPSHLLQCLLTDFIKELPSFSSTRVVRLSQTLFAYTCFTLLAPSCGRLLKLIYFFFILLHYRPITDSLCFAFLKAMLKAQVGDFFLSQRFNLAFRTCSLALWENLLLLLPSGACTGSWIRDGGAYTWRRMCSGCP